MSLLGDNFVRAVSIVVLSVCALFLVLHYILHEWHLVPISFLSDMFDLGAEGNVPTWFASILWFLVAQAALWCYVVESKLLVPPRWLKTWWFIGLTFLIASADDAATIHEQVGSFLQAQVKNAGLTLSNGSVDSPWILFYAPLLVPAILFMVIFLWRRLTSEKALQKIMIAAFGCYAIAIGLDYYQGLPDTVQYDVSNSLDLGRRAVFNNSIAIEETLENAGTALLLIVLLHHAEYIRKQRTLVDDNKS